jgi:hypothetical protein
MDKLELTTDMQNLYHGIAELIKQAKTRVAITINAELAMLNWQIGRRSCTFTNGCRTGRACLPC